MPRLSNHTRFAVAVAGALAGGATGATAQVTAADSAAAPLRWDGEYGLNVEVHGDTVTVRWLTGSLSRGSIRVLAGARERARNDEAPVDTVHTYSFRVPGRPVLTIRYGGLDDPAGLHETTIDLAPPKRSRVTLSAPDSVVVISDVHGEFDRMTAVLRNAGVIDNRLRWAGGRKHLIVLGDIFDRGPDVTRILWFLYGLERQAGGPGGRVHMVLGNHEAMVMQNDLRYVSDKENAIARRYGVGYASLFDPRYSLLGRWLASRPALLRMDDLLFVHGGVSSDFARWKIEQVDDTLAAYTAEELFARWSVTTYIPPLDSAAYVRRWDFFLGARSLFWYRGYLESDTTEAELDSVLEAFRARVMVVGHTTGPHVRERFGGKLVAVNTLPFAAEALLLVRRRNTWERSRIGESGPPVPLDSVGTSHRSSAPGPRADTPP